jgi:hypothetical protein
MAPPSQLCDPAPRGNINASDGRLPCDGGPAAASSNPLASSDMHSRLAQALFTLLRLLRLPRRIWVPLLTCWRRTSSAIRRSLKFLLGSKPSHDFNDLPATNHDSNMDQRRGYFPDKPPACDTVICASNIPSSFHKPMRRGSSSQPNLRDTLELAPIITRPASVQTVPPTHQTSSPPFDFPGPFFLTSHSPDTSTAVSEEEASDSRARTRAEHIANDARSSRRFSRSRAPSRQNLTSTGSIASRPPSVTIVRQRSGSPHARPNSSRVSIVGNAPVGINLELPLPVLDRHSHRTNSSGVGFSIQSPSTVSIPFSLPGPFSIPVLSAPPSPTASPSPPVSMLPSIETEPETVNTEMSPSSTFPDLPARHELRELNPDNIARWNGVHFA